MDGNTFKVINDRGEEITCDILFTFDNLKTRKSYIVYTDRTKDEDGNVQVYASIYDPKMENPKLEPIETEEEWEVVEKQLNHLMNQLQRNGDESEPEE